MRTVLVTCLAVVGALIGCAPTAPPQETQEQARGRLRLEAWSEPCHDESALLATTAGSPSSFECPNRLHKMRVQVATAPTNEEAAALVFCECQRLPADAGTRQASASPPQSPNGGK